MPVTVQDLQSDGIIYSWVLMFETHLIAINSPEDTITAAAMMAVSLVVINCSRPAQLPLTSLTIIEFVAITQTNQKRWRWERQGFL